MNNLIERLIAAAWTTGRGGCTVLDQAGHLVAQLGRRCVYYAADNKAQRAVAHRLAFMQVEFSNFSNDF